MKKTGCGIYSFSFLFFGLTLSFNALAFNCSNLNGNVIVDVDPSVFRNQPVTFTTKPGSPTLNYGSSWPTGTIPQAPTGSGFYCEFNYGYGDTVKITGISNIHSAINSPYYTAKITVGSIPGGNPGSADYTFGTVANNAYLLYNASRPYNWYRANTPPITVTLTRTADWVAKSISNGSTLLQLAVRRTDGGGQNIGTITFRVSGEVKAYTCTRTSPVDGQQITLPSVSAADLNGSPANNRYTAKSAPI
ncbi:hypothetical protein DXF93_29520, partial [Escherichia coli]